MRTVVEAVLSLVLLTGFGIAVVRLPLRIARLVWLGAFFLVVHGGISMMCTHSFVAKWSFRGDHPRDGLLPLVDGTAARPFVYRRLAPDLVGAATDALERRLSQGHVDYLVEQSPLRRYRGEWGESWGRRKAIAYHVAYFSLFSSFLGAMGAATLLLKTLRDGSWLEALVSAAIGGCLLPLMFVNGGYLYDAPELLLWTLLLLTACAGPFYLVPPIFGLMLVNKESALLAVVPLLPLLAARKGWKFAAAMGGLLSAMGVAWLFLVRQRYADRVGSPVEFSLFSNLQFWLNPRSYWAAGTPYAPLLPSPRGGNLVLLLLSAIPLRHGLRTLRRDVKLSLLLGFAIFIPMFLVAGSKDEVRGLSLLFPLMFVAACHGTAQLFAAAKPSPTTQATPPEA